MQRDDERLSGALQENILAVLCYDAAHCKIVRHAVKPQLFESSVFREVAGLAIDFIDQYGEPIHCVTFPPEAGNLLVTVGEWPALWALLA